MSGHALVVSGILFTAVGVIGYRNAAGLARVERNWTMRHALSGESDPRGWEVWLFEASAAAVAVLGVVVALLGVVALILSILG